MHCPTVVVDAEGQGSTQEESVHAALRTARARAARMCRLVDPSCGSIDPTPRQVALKAIRSTGPWDITLTCTFQCRHPGGCLTAPLSWLWSGPIYQDNAGIPGEELFRSSS